MLDNIKKFFSVVELTKTFFAGSTAELKEKKIEEEQLVEVKRGERKDNKGVKVKEK